MFPCSWNYFYKNLGKENPCDNNNKKNPETFSLPNVGLWETSLTEFLHSPSDVFTQIKNPEEILLRYFAMK